MEPKQAKPKVVMKNVYKELSPPLTVAIDGLEESIKKLELVMIDERSIMKKGIYAKQISEFCSIIEDLKEFKYTLPGSSVPEE